MKTLLLSMSLTVLVITTEAQNSGGDLFRSGNSGYSGSQITTATVHTSTRLFREKDDLTSVILIVPSGSAVTWLDSDSTYMHVIYDNNEGYIFRKHATITKVESAPAPAAATAPQVIANESASEQPADRYTYLVNKYGSVMADRIISGKIWKGMNSEMVRDSWGAAEKINRVINGNTIREEWIYRSTWLYFENNTLMQWGPTKSENH